MRYNLIIAEHDVLQGIAIQHLTIDAPSDIRAKIRGERICINCRAVDLVERWLHEVTPA